MTTVRAVLSWAVSPTGEPPAGPLWQAAKLGRPDAATRAVLAYAISATGARLGAGRPPLGDATPFSLYPLLLAAAIGGRHEAAVVDSLLALVPRLRLTKTAGWAEGLARHALVGPAVRANVVTMSRPTPTAPDSPSTSDADTAPPLTERLLTASPLTMVLHHPTPAARGASRSAAMALLNRPHGAAMLTGVLAAPSTDASVLSWRAELLEHLRQDNVIRLLDVYTAARLWHGSAWDAAAQAAAGELNGRRAPSDRAIATLRYWLPLATVEKQEQQAHRLGSKILGGQSPAPAKGASIMGRRSLRHEDYEMVVRLAERHRRSLQSGGT